MSAQLMTKATQKKKAAQFWFSTEASPGTEGPDMLWTMAGVQPLVVHATSRVISVLPRLSNCYQSCTVGAVFSTTTASGSPASQRPVAMTCNSQTY
jgi:hypothetical protein